MQLGNYMMRGRLHAIAVITMLALVSLLLSPFAYQLSGVPAGLVTLRRGPVLGFQILVGCVFATGLFVLLAQIPPQICLAFALVIWLPVWLCSVALRSTGSQGIMVLVAGAIGIGFIVVMTLVTDNTTAWWKNWLDAWIEVSLPEDLGFQYRQTLEPLLPLMNAIIGAGLVTSLILTMLIARWWQSGLYNPGAYGEEFRALRLPRLLLASAAPLLLLMIISAEPWHSMLRDMLLITVLLYLFHGLATVHRFVKKGNLSAAWLFGMYVVLLSVPQSVLFLACLGMADSLVPWHDKAERDNKI